MVLFVVAPPLRRSGLWKEQRSLQKYEKRKAIDDTENTGVMWGEIRGTHRIGMGVNRQSKVEQICFGNI